MHPALTQTDHRPWELPDAAWQWRQSWCDLLFAHWPVSAAVLRSLVPRPLEVQEFDGTAWLGIVPFRMAGVMRRPLPDLPYVSAFPELNVRTYVEHNGKPGVWFFSLDATNRLAVWAARTFFYLPYFHADITLQKSEAPSGLEVRYVSRRRKAEADFQATYGPTSDVFLAQPGTIEHWLTERYCLYAASPRNDIYCCDVHHVPWPLQNAQATIDVNRVTAPVPGLELPGEPTYLHFADQVDVVCWSPQRVGRLQDGF